MRCLERRPIPAVILPQCAEMMLGKFDTPPLLSTSDGCWPAGSGSSLLALLFGADRRKLQKFNGASINSGNGTRCEVCTSLRRRDPHRASMVHVCLCVLACVWLSVCMTRINRSYEHAEQVRESLRNTVATHLYTHPICTALLSVVDKQLQHVSYRQHEEMR